MDVIEKNNVIFITYFVSRRVSKLLTKLLPSKIICSKNESGIKTKTYIMLIRKAEKSCLRLHFSSFQTLFCIIYQCFAPTKNLLLGSLENLLTLAVLEFFCEILTIRNVIKTNQNIGEYSSVQRCIKERKSIHKFVQC